MTFEQQAEKIAGELRGTCRTLDEVLEAQHLDLLVFSQPFLDALDTLVWQCEVCGWWCDMDEMCEDDPGYCTDCCGHNH